MAESLEQELDKQKLELLTGPRYARHGGQPGLVRHGRQAGAVYLADQKRAFGLDGVAPAHQCEHGETAGALRAAARGL